MDFLNARWENLIMANYAVDPFVLLPFLPKGVELDTFNGKAFVSLVGFMFKDTRLFKMPIPLLGTFEEINLRFYVVRKEGNGWKRGVVFINETIPFKPVAWVANWLYKEHYISIPTKHTWNINDQNKEIIYEWKVGADWNHIKVNASNNKLPMEEGSVEQYIFEHYYGYTKVDNNTTQEYRVNHPRWETNKINAYEINCDFGKMYGKEFEFLNNEQPDNVIMAEGSEVSVKWKRKTI